MIKKLFYILLLMSQATFANSPQQIIKSLDVALKLKSIDSLKKLLKFDPILEESDGFEKCVVNQLGNEFGVGLGNFEKAVYAKYAVNRKIKFIKEPSWRVTLKSRYLYIASIQNKLVIVFPKFVNDVHAPPEVPSNK